MDEPVLATDQDGNKVEVTIVNGSDITLHWPDGYTIRLTSEQSLAFAKAAMDAYNAGEGLNIQIEEWRQ